MLKIDRVCGYCPKKLTSEQRTYCSLGCTSRATRPFTPMRTCHFCKKNFKRAESLLAGRTNVSGRIFCSRSCSCKGKTKPSKKYGFITCQHCQKTVPVPRRKTKIRKYCSQKCSQLAQRSSKKPRKSSRLLIWGKKVRKRDGYKCVRCGCDDHARLHAHHIRPFSQYPRLRYAVSNGKTLCKDCHAEEHPAIAHLILRTTENVKTRPNV